MTTADILHGSETMQLDFGGQLRESILGGAMDSYGLGTFVRELAVARGDTDPFGPAPAQPQVWPPEQPLPQSPPIDQETYQNSPFFRKDIPWDPRMAEDRAAALAAWYDAKQVRETRLGQTDGWAVKLLGNIAGQALDPINYIPFLGEAAKGAAVARFGVIGGRVAAASADAALNTAIFGALTSNERQSFGDDASFQSLLLDTASAAVIGAVFGSIGGALETRGVRQRATALRDVTTTHAALNDAVGSLLTDGEVRIRPETVGRLDRIAERENPAARTGPAAPVNEVTTNRRPSAQDTPAALELQDAIRQEALKADPELAQRYSAAQEQVRLAEQEIAQPQAIRPDDIRETNPEAADRLQAIDDETAQAPTPDRRVELERQRQQVVAEAAPERTVTPAPGAREKVAEARQQFEAVRQEVDTAAQQHLEHNRALYSPKLDTRAPPPEAPAPELAAAQQAVGKPIADAKALAKDFGIDHETGDFAASEDFAQLEQQGRLAPEDKRAVEEASEILERSKIYADALQQAAICGMN